MNPRLRYAVTVLICAAVAVCVGFQIAGGELVSMDLPGAVTGAALVLSAGAICVRLLKLPFDAILCGWLIIGYIVGNRGFAQLMPTPGIPLLPAEIALLVAGGWRCVLAAFARRLPIARDPLNWAVLAWLVAGTARLLFDVRGYGFVAIRDYAVVYYAAFFFLAQDMARDPAARRYLFGCLVASCTLLGPVFALYSALPDLFFRYLTLHGVPLIFYKGDLLNTFFAIGSLAIFLAAPARLRPWSDLAGIGMFIWVAAGDNRASFVGLLFATLLLVLARRWRYPLWQGASATLGLLTLLTLATVANNTWAERKLAGIADRALSVVDFTGERVYRSREGFHKGDNNRFRLIWWRNVVEQTWSEGPVFGVGFGADLAAGFLQEYYPESGEEFTARSPHNVFLTVFGRMGAVGLLVWLAVVTCIARQGWRALRHVDDPVGWALWCSLAVMLTSATFGVVLEGPMGAVPFWILLGIANARLRAYAEEEEMAGAQTTPTPAPKSHPAVPVPS